MHICLITSRLPPAVCGVGDYTLTLALRLHLMGHRVTLLTHCSQATHDPTSGLPYRNVLPSWGPRGMLRLAKELRHLRPDRVIVQWVPYLYSRTGVNLWLAMAVVLLRREGFRFQVTVHEPWVDLSRPKFWITGSIQRVALGLLIRSSERASVSISSWTEMLRRRFPQLKSRIHWVPVGSNIAEPGLPRPASEEERVTLGIPRGAIVLGTFSPGGSGKGYRLIEEAWKAARVASPAAWLLVIGGSREEAIREMPSLVGDERCRITGRLPAEEVSRFLLTMDLYLAPFTDGISTRRGSAMAAMAHGLPVVTTRGHLLDGARFVPSPVIVTDFAPEAFTAAVLKLLRDPRERSAIGRETRLFYEKFFSWEKIATGLLGAPEPQPIQPIRKPFPSRGRRF